MPRSFCIAAPELFLGSRGLHQQRTADVAGGPGRCIARALPRSRRLSGLSRRAHARAVKSAEPQYTDSVTGTPGESRDATSAGAIDATPHLRLHRRPLASRPTRPPIACAHSAKSRASRLTRWCARVKQQPAPRKRRGRLLYAGFSQASGFHPDGTWGVGIHTDMTVAYSIAITECESRTSESCASAGYCLMQPGKYSAWASDGRSPGGSGYACNYATEAEARYTAALWCSGQCRLLWSGGNPEAATMET